MEKQVRMNTIGLVNGQGPAVFPVQLISTDLSAIDLVAWIGNFGSSNVYVYEGEWNLRECQQDIAENGSIGCVAALTEAGPITVPLEDGCRVLTVFFEAKNEAGQVQAVCLKTIEREARS
jgi:hypothetical protein